MSNDRETILGRVKHALAPLQERAPLPDWESELVVLREARRVTDPWPLFAARLKGVNGTPLTQVGELVTLLREAKATHGYCDPAWWPQLQAAFPAEEFSVETEFDRTRVDDYAFGITAATGAIAETGTLILSDRDTSSRLGALAPWVHVAVLKREQLHVDIPAAIAAMPQDPNLIWVTGPSKTADVEGILIEGVHGPGVQVALLLD